MDLVAPYRQPCDFMVKGDPRTFADLLTSRGLDFVRTYRRVIRRTMDPGSSPG